MIDYRLLQALAAVVAEQGFEKAANVLCLTQSAVSRRVRQLEIQLGEPVLERSQPPRLTATGSRLLNHLQQVRQLEAGLGLMVGETGAAPLQVRLATNADSLATWLAPALVSTEFASTEFVSTAPSREPSPALVFDLVVVDQSIGLQRMKSGDVMACICDSAHAVPAGKIEPLGAMRYRLVASPRLLMHYNYQGVQQLARLPWLVYDRDDQLQHQFLQRVAGCSPQWVHLCPSSEGFRQAILAGLGVGLLPDLQIGSAITTGALVDLTPGEYLDTPLYWHYWHTESPVLAALRARVKAIAATQLQPLHAS